MTRMVQGMHLFPLKSSYSILIIITVIAGSFRFFGLGAKQLWVDEIIQALHSQPDSLKEILVCVSQDRGGSPLDYVIQHFFITSIAADIEWTARIHTAIFGTLAIPLIYIISRKLLNSERSSLLSAWLLCFFPLNHHYSQEGRPYALFALLTLCLYIVLFRLLEKQNYGIWICFVLTATLSFYAHAYTALVLLTQFCYLLYRQVLTKESLKTTLRLWAYFLLGSMLASAAYLPWLVYSFDNAKGDAAEPIELNLILRTVKEFADGSYPLAAAIMMCFVAGVVYLYRNMKYLQLGALLIWILVPFPVIVGVLLWRDYFFATRQVIFIAPAVIIMAAHGVYFIKNKVNRNWFRPELILILISLVVIMLHLKDDRIDFRAVGNYLARTARPSDIIIAPNIDGLLSFYFPDIYSHEREFSNVARIDSRVIYVDSEFNTNRTGLDVILSRLTPREIIDFRGLKVYLFCH